jgi:hypothetical protein
VRSFLILRNGEHPMSKSASHVKVYSSRSNPQLRAATVPAAAATEPDAQLESAEQQLWKENQALHERILRMMEELAAVRAQVGTPASERVANLTVENEELRRQVAQFQDQLQFASLREESWRERLEAFDRLLEENRQLREQVATLPTGPDGAEETQAGAGENQVAAAGQMRSLQEALEQERETLLREWQTLEHAQEEMRRDEEIMCDQMRNMEVQLARERAEIANQRRQLQNLYDDVKRELENAPRDAAVRDRLAAVYQLRDETYKRRGDSGVRSRGQEAEPAATGQPATTPENTKDTKIVRRSGFFRRLFQRDTSTT